jgi:hypothetical protein
MTEEIFGNEGSSKSYSMTMKYRIFLLGGEIRYGNY